MTFKISLYLIELFLEILCFVVKYLFIIFKYFFLQNSSNFFRLIIPIYPDESLFLLLFLLSLFILLYNEKIIIKFRLCFFLVGFYSCFSFLYNLFGHSQAQPIFIFLIIKFLTVSISLKTIVRFSVIFL